MGFEGIKFNYQLNLRIKQTLFCIIILTLLHNSINILQWPMYDVTKSHGGAKDSFKNKRAMSFNVTQYKTSMDIAEGDFRPGV